MAVLERLVVLLGLLGVPALALEVRLASPLTTQVDLVGEFPPRTAVLEAQITVPDDAPAAVQVSAYAIEDGGFWRQGGDYQQLSPGINQVRLMVPGRIGAAADVRSIAGMLFSSAVGSGARLRVDQVRISDARMSPAAPSPRILDLAQENTRVVTGRPWCLSLRPESGDGFMLAGRVTGPDGVVTRIMGQQRDERWSLTFTAPHAGRYQIDVSAHWPSGERVIQTCTLDAAGELPPPIQSPIAVIGAAQAIGLLAPLRTCWAMPLANGLSACRISARVQVGVDAPDDLVVGAYARDGVGRWRQSDERRALHPGLNQVEFLIPAGGLASAAGSVENGVGEAGLVWWSARTSAATVWIGEVHLTPVSTTPANERYLDRLSFSGVTCSSQSITATVGSTWSAAVSVADASAVAVACSARVRGPDGQTSVVPAMSDLTGRQQIDFHPSLPGAYTVRLIGRWSDGQTVESELPLVTVIGESPCRTATSLTLRGPLSTSLELPIGHPGRARRIDTLVLVPDGAPADLTVNPVAIDHHDRWFQPIAPQALHPGINRVSFPIERDAALTGGWTAESLAQVERTALIFSTTSSTPLRLTVGEAAVRSPVPEVVSAAIAPSLRELAYATTTATTGERWSLSLCPAPFPGNPYDPDEFRLDLEVAAPDGSRQLLPGFYAEDMIASDGGDRESLQVHGAGRFVVRYRPHIPGVHRLTILATWRDGGSLRCALPSLVVSGERWDGYVRVERKDPRFFAVDGRFFWPVGPNMRSVTDGRAQERMHTNVTPDRGSLAYRAYLQRFAAAGANACEIWMSAWNLALEWRGDWPGFAGVGRYNQANAWRLDQILDAAWAAGMRVNLVINNHGQGSEKTDAEWMNNPYNRLAGGRLDTAAQLFRDPWAKLSQDKLRRYLIGRYADHPAVLGWKLWTEMNLTSGGGELRPWHEQAVKRWHELDPYGHPVTSHWSGDYRSPTADIVTLLDYVCIDAYHDEKPENPYHLVHRMLRDSTLAGNGLARLGLPVLVTEYGGNWSGTRTPALMTVDHTCGAWVGFVTGHAGAPMLWWFEWIDQGERFAPYGAIQRFIAGEDLRGDGRPAAVRIDGADGLWAAAWQTRTSLYGYVLDERWAEDGTSVRSVDAHLTLDAWPAGQITCEWWNADTGKVVSVRRLSHSGGPLSLVPPSFRKHLAWKLRP